MLTLEVWGESQIRDSTGIRGATAKLSRNDQRHGNREGPIARCGESIEPSRR